jgi:hypothetical protein
VRRFQTIYWPVLYNDFVLWSGHKTIHTAILSFSALSSTNSSILASNTVSVFLFMINYFLYVSFNSKGYSFRWTFPLQYSKANLKINGRYSILFQAIMQERTTQTFNFTDITIGFIDKHFNYHNLFHGYRLGNSMRILYNTFPTINHYLLKVHKYITWFPFYSLFFPVSH